jgi:alpha-mannosidase
MPDHLPRSIAYRVLTSRPLNPLAAHAFYRGFRRFGAGLVPHEWIDGIDRFFVRDLMGNVDLDGDGAPDGFRLAICNAWYDQRITGVTISMDGRRLGPGEVLLHTSRGQVRAGDITSLDFPPGEAVEIIMPGRTLADGLHILDMVVNMELAPMIIPVLPLLVRNGAADVLILEDRFSPLPEWPPPALEPGTVHVVPHIHYDVEWLQSREVFEPVGEANLREALRLMEADPEMTFVVDQVPHLEPFRRRDPRGFERLVELVQLGRVEAVNGMYSEPDTNLVSGESLVRQSVAWQRYALKTFGAYSRCGWLIDSFGMSAQLPQILASSGTDFFAFSRARVEAPAPSEFTWEGLDGTRITAHNMPLMYNAGHPVPKDSGCALRRMLKNYRHLRARSASGQVFYPSGVDHGRPQKEYGEMARAWNEEVDDVKFEFSTPSRFFESLPRDSLPVLRCEFQRELWGTYSARVGLKQLNRACEFALLDAGKLSALASLQGKAFGGRENEWAWQQLMDNQFHDQICGCSVDRVAAGMRDRMNGLLDATQARMRESAWHLAGRPRGEGKDGFTVLAFNPLARPGRSWVECELTPPPGWSGIELTCDGQWVPFQMLDAGNYGDGSLKKARIGFCADLPALGYRLFEVRPGDSVGPPRGAGASVTVSGATLANGLLTVELDGSTGLLGQAVTGDGTRFDFRGGNRLTLERDIGNLYTSTPLGNTWMYRRRVSSVRAIEAGPLRGTIAVRGSLGRSEFEQTVSLAAGSSRIDCETRIDFRDRGCRLRCAFPTGMDRGRWVHEVPYGWLERPGHELPAQNFVDLSSGGRGVTLVNCGIPSNQLLDGTMFLTLLRGSDRIYEWYAGPDALEIGEHTFRYSLFPHEGDHVEAGSALEAYRRNDPPRAFVFRGLTGGETLLEFSGLSCSPEEVMVSVMERNADGSMVVRLWESSGRPREARLELGWEPKSVQRTDLLERREEELVVGSRSVTVPLRGFEIATLLM